jgi:hypothetical protein
LFYSFVEIPPDFGCDMLCPIDYLRFVSEGTSAFNWHYFIIELRLIEFLLLDDKKEFLPTKG